MFKNTHLLKYKNMLELSYLNPGADMGTYVLQAPGWTPAHIGKL